MLKHIPTEAEAQLILDRWMQQQRFICQSNEQNLFTACAVLRGDPQYRHAKTLYQASRVQEDGQY
jgi:hypothetical protein